MLHILNKRNTTIKKTIHDLFPYFKTTMLKKSDLYLRKIQIHLYFEKN